MASGGARTRRNLPDPFSARSEARGYRLAKLPSEPYSGPVPAFPLPDPSDRELEVWREVWTYPQAWAWSVVGQEWRASTVAMWVRVKVRCEDTTVTAALLGQLHRFADQIGLTSAGLTEMGWTISDARPVSDPEAEPSQRPRSSRDRMKVVRNKGEVAP